ncbi:cytochrome c biogenesis protein CcdA [Vibrio inusitatus NBRC 102082]|uniref:Cytochrome c biogenesis protein CcdA n=1 Tax=Vibrio inusitatus NBRC 102082 TaxID=1219070 RepID=A0A4Y3HTH9_9VIBR|nr:SPOR domain-containing protein [Vibrio inusitatus]GEA50386.1 cytochrome c biogenesis protein CcdA [Vibrio inusitatus NBRC 102082]
MKKTAIVSLALLLAACSSSDYESDVQSESYQENYQSSQTEVDESKAEIEEEDVAIVEEQVSEIEEQDAVETDEVAKGSEAQAEGTALAPTEGFSIQLATISDEEKARAFGKALNAESDLWLQSKEINNKPVYSVLMGDFGDYDEAKAAVASLPDGLQKLKPFVKNFTDKELAATDSFELLK